MVICPEWTRELAKLPCHACVVATDLAIDVSRLYTGLLTFSNTYLINENE